MVWGASYRCGDCGVVHSAGPLGGEKELKEKLRPEFHHVRLPPSPPLALSLVLPLSLSHFTSSRRVGGGGESESERGSEKGRDGEGMGG